MGGELVRHLPVGLAACLLGAIVFLPTAISPSFPLPVPTGGWPAKASFNREVLALLRRREVLIALLLFVAPCSSFALANILGGLGGDFHASARMVNLAGGAGAFFPGIFGCLLLPIIAKRLPLRFFYLANGTGGCLFTVSIILLPRTPRTFIVALVGEFLFQAVAFCIQIGIVFETIGQNNPLAAATFAFLAAATNIPVTYMMVVDGRGYSMGGVAGSLAMDAGIGIAACLLLGLLLYCLPGKGFSSGIPVIETLVVLPQEE
jgi:PAT family beta-lactamase induction signal transducer AmpG